MTKSLDFLLTQRTIKATRIQLNELRRRRGTGVALLAIPGGLEMEFDLSDDLDAFMYDHLVRNGHYEEEVESALLGLLSRHSTFVDVGANIGYFTLLCSSSARAVYSFEPVPSVFERLSGNIALNGIANVSALPLAVYREKARLKLYESRVSPGHDSFVRRSEHEKASIVDAVTLDEALGPDEEEVVMKVDVEGSEMDVILGASGLIRSGRVSAIVLEWARGLYPEVANLRDRFSLYSSLGTVEVLDGPQRSHVVRDRHDLPEICNLLIRVRR